MGSLVETSGGRAEGSEEGGVSVFRGLPYARAPEGPLRWRAPEPAAAWSGVRDARRFGRLAPQVPGMIGRLMGAEAEPKGEDCLFANVWTPAADAGRRPVLVWIHGGGFTSGGASWPVFDGAPLARRGDAVVVTLNYRLGALGFLPVPGLAGDGRSAANLGLLDQLAGLAWVRENAGAFGGDPENVTVFGESAGAMSVAALVAMPAARGLFRRAIVQSGAPDYVHDEADARRVADCFLRELAVGDDPERLRALPVGAILEAQAAAIAALAPELPRLAFQPAVDGDLLPRPPLDAIREGAVRVPLLVGTNLDEWKLYGLGDPRGRGLDDPGLLRRMQRGLPGRDGSGRPWAERVIEVYRDARAGRADTAASELWFAIQSDRWFRHPAMRLAELAARGGASVHAYLFDWSSPALDGWLGSCHSLEVPFVFGTAGLERVRPFVGEGPAVGRLSESIQAAWLAFARGGDPAAAGLPTWPRYDAPRRATLRLGADCRVEDAPLEVERAFWDEVG